MDLSAWERKKEYSINQASLLIVGLSPDQEELTLSYLREEDRASYAAFEIIRDTLCKAVEHFELEVLNHSWIFENGGRYGPGSVFSINPQNTFINIEELLLWIHHSDLKPKCWRKDLEPANIERLLEKQEIRNYDKKRRYKQFVESIPAALKEIDTIRKSTERGLKFADDRADEALEYYDNHKVEYQYVKRDQISDLWFQDPKGPRNARDIVLEDLAHRCGINITKQEIQKLVRAIQKDLPLPVVHYSSRSPHK